VLTELKNTITTIYRAHKRFTCGWRHAGVPEAACEGTRVGRPQGWPGTLPGDVALEAAAVEVVDPAVESREPPATALFVRACLRGTSGEFGLEDLGGGAAGAEAGGDGGERRYDEHSHRDHGEELP
jgi:hypothetical protein